MARRRAINPRPPRMRTKAAEALRADVSHASAQPGRALQVHWAPASASSDPKLAPTSGSSSALGAAPSTGASGSPASEGWVAWIAGTEAGVWAGAVGTGAWRVGCGAAICALTSGTRGAGVDSAWTGCPSSPSSSPGSTAGAAAGCGPSLRLGPALAPAVRLAALDPLSWRRGATVTGAVAAATTASLISESKGSSVGSTKSSIRMPSAFFPPVEAAAAFALLRARFLDPGGEELDTGLSPGIGSLAAAASGLRASPVAVRTPSADRYRSGTDAVARRVPAPAAAPFVPGPAWGCRCVSATDSSESEDGAEGDGRLDMGSSVLDSPGAPASRLAAEARAPAAK
mmetsp:Transcript_823/g.2566  ORF Transcript_823/g.2566 Transcript_823/m.2566 type:complete len:343 (+) Transcript_823:738-1766(+)